MASTPATEQKSPRQRVPAAERRDALIDAAVHEFARGGLYGTPVDRIARRVGVAQPYVFSLFANKRELFLAAVERCFERVAEMFTKAAEEFDPATAPPEVDVFKAMGNAYVELLDIRSRLPDAPAPGVRGVRRRGDPRTRPGLLRATRGPRRGARPDAEPERIDEFFRYGMWLNVAAAMGVEDLSVGCEWVQADALSADSAERIADRQSATRRSG